MVERCPICDQRITEEKAMYNAEDEIYPIVRCSEDERVNPLVMDRYGNILGHYFFMSDLIGRLRDIEVGIDD